MLRSWLAGALLVVGCLFIYRASLGFGFVMFDDDVNFIFNRDFGPLDAERLRWIATEHATMMRYVPLGWLACCALASLGGLDPFWFHLSSVLLHAGACVVLFAVLARVAPLLRPPASGATLPRALSLLPFALAAWWGWHPLRVETVAWITPLIYLLATLLGLFSLLAFLHALDREKHRPRPLLASLLLFAAALLSHPAAISFLPLLAACAAVRLLPCAALRSLRADRAPLTRLGKLLLPFVVLGALDLAVTLFVRQLDSVIPHAPTPTLAEFGLGERLAQACAVLTHFIAKIAVPTGLGPAYPLLEFVTPLAPRFLFSMFACAGLALGCGLLLRHRFKPGVFALATFAACAPFLGLQEHPFFPCDRYTHIAMIGLACCGLAAGSVSPRLQTLVARVVPFGLLLLLPLWIAVSVRQLNLWSSDRSLFEGLAALQASPGKRDAYSARLLNIHLNRGEIGEARLRLALMATAGAPASILAALHEKITVAAAVRGPALCADLLAMQARYAAGQGDAAAAIDRLRRALVISPHFGPARFSLGLLLARDGDAAGALAQLLWLQRSPAELPPEALLHLRTSVAAAFRSQGQERLATLTAALPPPSSRSFATPVDFPLDSPRGPR